MFLGPLEREPRLVFGGIRCIHKWVCDACGTPAINRTQATVVTKNVEWAEYLLHNFALIRLNLWFCSFSGNLCASARSCSLYDQCWRMRLWWRHQTKPWRHISVTINDWINFHVWSEFIKLIYVITLCIHTFPKYFQEISVNSRIITKLWRLRNVIIRTRRQCGRLV